MNEIPIQDIYADLGPAGQAELKMLQTFLGLPEPDRARYSPSLMTRSEAAILNVSAPRFAYRLYYPNGVGFINCRRVRALVQALEPVGRFPWGARSEDLPSENRNPDVVADLGPPDLRHPMQEEDQSCIADSILSPPATYNDRYHILYGSFGMHYGEPRLRGCVPFAKNSQFGGGLCAQSACFMATAIMQPYSRGIYGLAEITAFAHEYYCSELALSGLSMDSMANYFRAIGLRADQQLPTTPLYPQSDTLELLDREFERAVSSYIRSGMPVILPTDAGRLAWETMKVFENDLPKSVYQRNQFIVPPMRNPRPQRHLIVLIGYSKTEAGVPAKAIFHDPSAMPFMVAYLRQLSRVGCYVDATKELTEDRLLFPVTPGNVRMPLLSWRSTETSSRLKHGLLWLSNLIHSLPDGTLPQPANVHGRFMLMQVHSVHRALSLVFLGTSEKAALAANLLTLEVEIPLRLKWSLDHWVWVESTGDALWIWDAEREPAFSSDFEQFEINYRDYLRTVVSPYAVKWI